MNKFRLSIFVFYLSITALALLCNACTKVSTIATTPQIQLRSIYFINPTDAAIHNVQLRVKTFGGLISSNLILPGQQFSTTFPIRNYQKQPVYLSWTHRNQHWQAGPIIIDNPSGIVANTPSSVKVVFANQGQAEAFFIQE